MRTDPQPLATAEGTGFWRGKTPCWLLLDCSPYVYRACAAYQHPEKPCWQHPVTRCESVLNVPRDCTSCEVFELYHHASPPVDQA